MARRRSTGAVQIAELAGLEDDETMTQDGIMTSGGDMSGSGSDFGTSDDDSSGEQSGFDSDDVYELFCAKCCALVTRRGSRVRLIADEASEMFSTDLVTTGMEDRGRVRTHDACDCEIRDIFCACCRTVLGYHVLEPCWTCSEGGNNGHYYMFVPGNVRGHRRAMPSIAPDWSTNWTRWDSIGAFEPRDVRRSIDRAVFISDEDEVRECTCAVCLDILEQPLTLPCGHTFCRVCASRAVDLQRCWCEIAPTILRPRHASL
jgi:hypothetical protein